MPNCRKTHEWFVKQANLIYGTETFIYLTQYETARKPIHIRCVTCNREFQRTPNGHLRQPHGCISCAQMTDRYSLVSSIQHEILEGLIISDGCVHRFRPVDRLTTPVLIYKNVESEFVVFLMNNLPFKETSQQIVEACENTIYGTPYNQKRITTIQTRSDKALIPYWDRWYGGEKKHVPTDFILTPLTGRVWFYGDGSSTWYEKATHMGSRIRLCTNSFTSEDCERLCNIWNSIGIKFYSAPTKHGPVLTLDVANDINAFFDYIGEPELECFRYKWKRSYNINKA